MNDKHLMRTWYKTDVSDDDPEYVGNTSATIPARAFESGYQIVAVDWSTHGEVEVTFLIPGSGFRPAPPKSAEAKP